VLPSEGGEALKRFVGDFGAGGSECGDCSFKVDGIPEHNRGDRPAAASGYATFSDSAPSAGSLSGTRIAGRLILASVPALKPLDVAGAYRFAVSSGTSPRWRIIRSWAGWARPLVWSLRGRGWV
jgi:hypothetical protein